jgi:uncharacterized protein YjaG (DUF416 family)
MASGRKASHVSTNNFDIQALQLELDKLPPSHRIAFAASCCERLVPEHASLSLNPSYGRYAKSRADLDQIWELLSGKALPLGVLRTGLRYWEDDCAETEDFARCRKAELLCGSRAVLKTSQCLEDGSSERAAQVAAHVLAAISMFIRCVNSTLLSDVADKTQSHPMFLDEIQRQQELLEALGESCGLDASVAPKEWFHPPADLSCALHF